MQYYRQSTPFTGAACSLLMALHYLNPKDNQLERADEFTIWRESVNLPTRSSSIYGLANYAANQGVKAHVVAESLEYDYPDYRFKRYKKVEIEDAGFMSQLHEKEAREAGVTIEEQPITVKMLSELLSNDKLLLLRVNAGVLREQRATSKYVLIYDKDDSGQFKVMDPEQGQIAITEEELEEALDTLKTKKKRDSRVLVLN